MKYLMGALRQLALADSGISALVEGRVYVNSIPRSEIEAASTFHPPKMLVLRQSGGSPQADFLPTEQPLVTALCYGESDYEAGRVLRAVAKRFKYLERETFSDGEGETLVIHWINRAGGAIPSVEGDLAWPAIAQSFSLMADTKES